MKKTPYIYHAMGALFLAHILGGVLCIHVHTYTSTATDSRRLVGWTGLVRKIHDAATSTSSDAVFLAASFCSSRSLLSFAMSALPTHTHTYIYIHATCTTDDRSAPISKQIKRSVARKADG